jgi:hypothetical protein
MSELLPKLEPLKGDYDDVHKSLVDCTYVENDPETGGPTIRFSIAIANTGKGPLYVTLGAIKKENGKEIAPAKQKIFNENGQFREVDVGYFELHRHEHPGAPHDHPHWHYDGLASLELVDEVGQIVAKSGKDSYCVVDVFKYQNLPDSPPSAIFPFEACETITGTVEVGISVGWADYYRPRADLQYISIENIKSGVYSLRFRINKTKLFHEESEPISLKIKIDKEKGEVRPT